MLGIARLGFGYDPGADRLVVQLGGRDHALSLQLTRRVAIRWLKVLVAWMEARSAEAGTPEQRLRALRNEHVRALGAAGRCAAAQTQGALAAAGAGGPEAAPNAGATATDGRRTEAAAIPEQVKHEKQTSVAQLTRIEFGRRKNQLSMLFYSDAGEPVAAGQFGVDHVHVLVDRLCRAMLRAGWGEGPRVPDWSRQRAKEVVVPPKKPVLH